MVGRDSLKPIPTKRRSPEKSTSTSNLYRLTQNKQSDRALIKPDSVKGSYDKKTSSKHSKQITGATTTVMVPNYSIPKHKRAKTNNGIN